MSTVELFFTQRPYVCRSLAVPSKQKLSVSEKMSNKVDSSQSSLLFDLFKFEIRIFYLQKVGSKLIICGIKAANEEYCVLSPLVHNLT